MKRLVLMALLAMTLLGACGGPTPAPARTSAHPPGWGLPAAPQAAQKITVVPTATMYDTITLGTVPPGPFALAGYTSGYWPTYWPLRRRYPRAHVVSIAVTAANHADCLDVEPGDASPSQVPSWVRGDKSAGFARPCVYSSYWEYVNEIRPILNRAGIGRNQVWEWDANYTYRPHLDRGFDATQYTDRALGRNLDASVVTRSFLSIAQPPLVRPKPPVVHPAARIALLRKLARLHGCYVKHHRHPRACKVWGAEVRHLTPRGVIA